MLDKSGIELRFAEFLKEHHSGKQCAITAKNLKIWGSGQEIRGIVHKLRKNGIPICSGAEGYYYAENLREIETTLYHLNKRHIGIKIAADGLHKTYLEMKQTQTQS